MKYSEEEMLHHLTQDRETGAAMLLEQYAGLLWTVCHRHLDNEEDIRECVNSTFADVCLHLDKYDASKGSLKNYLCRIAEKKAIDRYHENYRRLQVEETMAEQSQREQEAVYSEKVMTEHLEEALEHLEPLDSQILRMKYYDGMSYQEIASHLGLTEGTVKMRSMRSRRKLGKILLLLIVLAMLAACAVAVLRQYRFHERYGIFWDGENTVYELVGEGISWEQDQVRYEVRDAVYQKVNIGTPVKERYQLTLYVRVYWQGEQTEGWSSHFPGAVRDVLYSLRPTEDMPATPLNSAMNSGWRYLSDSEMAMETYADIELMVEWELDRLDEDGIGIALYTDAGFVGEITLEPTPLVEYEEPKTSYELVDDICWRLGPAVEGEQFTIVSLSLQDRGSWRISQFLNSSPGGNAGREDQLLVLEAADGTTYTKMRSAYSLHEPVKGWLQHQYEIYFRDVPAGEYTLHIPYLFLRRDWTSEEFTLTLPQVSDQKVDCDVTALFPDGSGFHIIGITRTEEEMISYDWIEETEELIEVRRLYWRYTLEMEAISVGELEMYLCLLGYEGEGIMLPEQENGVLSFSFLQEEAPEYVNVYWKEPEYILDRSYYVPVTIVPSRNTSEVSQ